MTLSGPAEPRARRRKASATSPTRTARRSSTWPWTRSAPPGARALKPSGAKPETASRPSRPHRAGARLRRGPGGPGGQEPGNVAEWPRRYLATRRKLAGVITAAVLHRGASAHGTAQRERRHRRQGARLHRPDAARSAEAVGASGRDRPRAGGVDRPGRAHESRATASGAAVTGGTGHPQRHGRKTAQRVGFPPVSAGQAGSAPAPSRCVGRRA